MGSEAIGGKVGPYQLVVGEGGARTVLEKHQFPLHHWVQTRRFLCLCGDAFMPDD